MRVLSWLFLAALGAVGRVPACEGEDPAAWTRSHQELRSTKGHFSGGNWSPAVDAWGGTKHRLMQCLARHATAKSVRAPQLRRLMGPPDEVLRCPSPACTEALEKAEWPAGRTAPPSPAEMWLYDWRGRHDRLVFVLSAGAVRSSGWLYARE